MSVYELLLLIWRRRWLVAATTVLMGVLAAVVALLTTPTYRAEVLLAPVRAQNDLAGLSSLVGQLGGLASLAGTSLSGDDRSAEAIATLRSRSLTEEFIKDNDLLPMLFPDAWDAEARAWKDLTQQPTMGDALLLFDEQVRSVRQDLQTGLVTLRIDWRDRVLAAQWANELVARANEVLRTRAIQEADQSLEYLATALSAANNVELRSAISTLMESHLQSRTFASVRADFAFRVVDPAVVSDPDKRVRPRRTLMVLAGLMAGIVIGVLVASFLDFARGPRSAVSAK
jgi:uncharacterized protein involved in exopolysaccharide biosynthesis